MAYRNPKFVFDSQVRDSGGFTIEASNAMSGSLSPASLGLLTDDFMGAIYLSTFPIVGENDYLTFFFDWDESLAVPDTLIIPPGSSLYKSGSSVIEVSVRLSNTIVFSPVNVTETSGPIVLDLADSGSGPSSKSSVIFKETGGNRHVGPISLGEIILGTKIELERGPAPGWRHSVLSNLDRLETKSGISSQWLNGRPRRTWQFLFSQLSDDDMQKLSGLYTQAGGGSRVFWFLPPDDSLDWTPVLLSRDAEITADSDVPLVTSSNSVSLEIIEALG